MVPPHFLPFGTPNFCVEYFVMKFLEMLPLCEKIRHEKSYLDILNGN
jgi:hypothetical protein